jgi:hypothetical protein
MKPYCDTASHPLILSDRAEIFTTDSLDYSPEVVLAVFLFNLYQDL